MAAMTDDDFALELELDRLLAALAGEEPLRWTAARRQGIAKAFASATWRGRALAIVQAQLPAWIEQSPAVAAARLAPPSWPAYRRLRAAQEAMASLGFAAEWSALLRWHSGAPIAPLPAPRGLPAMHAQWIVGEAPLPWRAAAFAFEQHARAQLSGLGFAAAPLDVRFAAARPRTRVTAHRLELSLRDDRDTPRAWFQLFHELGHALAAWLSPSWLPRAVDEAVAAWLARHLEEPASLPAVAAHAFGALHGEERLRRTAVAIALAHLEAGDLAERDEAATAPSPTTATATATATVPWALWHDGGAQVAYLHAEALAARWWEAGLRLGDLSSLARAVAAARAEALAQPPPFTAIRAIQL